MPVCIDIDTNNLKIAEFRKKRDKLIPCKYCIKSRTDLSQESLQKDIDALFNESGIKTEKVYLTIPDTEIYLFTFSIPGIKTMPAKKREEYILWQCKDELPFPIEQAVMDYKVISDKVGKSENKSLDDKLNVIAEVTNKSIIAKYINVLSKYKVELIDSSTLRIANLCKEDSFVLVNMADSCITLEVFQNNVVTLARTINVDGSTADSNVVQFISESIRYFQLKNKDVEFPEDVYFYCGLSDKKLLELEISELTGLKIKKISYLDYLYDFNNQDLSKKDYPLLIPCIGMALSVEE